LKFNNLTPAQYFWLRTASTFTALSIIGVLVAFITHISTDNKEDDQKYLNLISEKYSVFAIPIPDTIYFADERVPSEFFDVYENLDREFLVNTYWHSQTFLFLKRANRYFPVIEPILKKNGVPDDFKYLCVAESGLTNVVSPAGAAGFWQFLKATGERYGLIINDEIDERYHLVKSTNAACAYLKESYETYGDWTLVAASFNMGMGGLDKQIKKQGVKTYYDLYLNEETSRYLFRIISIKMIMEKPEAFGIHYRKKDLYPIIPVEQIKADTSITDLATWALGQNINYKLLKIFNPWLRQNTLTIEPGKSYQIDIPLEGYRNLEKLRGIAQEDTTAGE
jgi:membrane-bound lytic murein transglycosylase D